MIGTESLKINGSLVYLLEVLASYSFYSSKKATSGKSSLWFIFIKVGKNFNILGHKCCPGHSGPNCPGQTGTIGNYANQQHQPPVT